MFTYIWHTLFFDPVYNTLVFFIDTIRNGDVGLAIIATVIVVKMTKVLYTGSKKKVCQIYIRGILRSFLNFHNQLRKLFFSSIFCEGGK